MICNLDLAQMMLSRFVYKFPNLILILHKNGHHWQYLFLICWNLKILSNDVCNVLYKDSSFNLILVKNMAAIGNSCLRNYKLTRTQTVHE